MTPETETGPVLRTYLQIARRRAWWIVIAAVLGLGASLAFALTSPKQYSATAQILVQPSGTAFGTSLPPVTATDIQTDIQLVTSAPVQSAVARQLGTVPPVAVAEVAQTNVISITAVSRTPASAARIANAYADAFVTNRQQAALAAITNAETQLSRQIAALDPQIQALRLRTSAAAQLAALTNQQAVEKQQLVQMQVQASSMVLGGVSVVTPAIAPVAPSSPKPVQDALLGLMTGLILGIGLAFMRENFDDSLRSKEAAEQLGGAPVLAMVPVIPSWKRREAPLVVALSQPLSAPVEAYRSLRTSLQFLGQERELRMLVVTSAVASEGKTTTVANLGAVFAQAGERVLLVSSDLRQPRLADFFGLDEERGLTSVLRNELSLRAAIQPVTGLGTLWLLAAGQVPGNPAELLGGHRARELFRALRAEFDLVLIDSPPVLPVTDAVVLSKYADGTLVVCGAKTKRVALQRAAEKLGRVNAPVVGLILSEVTRQDAYGYGYGYGDEYVSDRKEQKRRATSEDGSHGIRPSAADYAGNGDINGPTPDGISSELSRSTRPADAWAAHPGPSLSVPPQSGRSGRVS